MSEDLNHRQRYNKIFIESLSTSEESLENLEYNSIAEWDSVGHMSLMAALEEEFEIMMEMEEIIDFSSYKIGKEILSKHGVKFD